jgi:butyrate kinase
MFTVLALNPGSTSTKMALYQDDHCLFTHSLEHRHEELLGFPTIVDQGEYRRAAVLATLQERKFKLQHLSALVVRGGT